MSCPGSLLDDGSGNCVDPQTGVTLIPSSAGSTVYNNNLGTLSAPTAAGPSSAFDWHTIIGGTLGIIGASVSASTPNKTTTNFGIPGSQQARPPVAGSQTTGLLVAAAVIALVVWLVRRTA